MLLGLPVLYSCVSPGGAGGLLYNNYTGPYQALENSGTSREGRASVHCILGLTCFGNAGIHAAVADGSIQRISSVDYQYLSFLAIVYTRTTIIVRGE